MSYADAHSAIRTRFEEEWSSRTPVHYPNVKFEVPGSGPWVRLTIEDASSDWASFGDPGNNVERNRGQVTVQIFSDTTTGEGEALRLADIARDIFLLWDDRESGVRFLDPPYVRQVGVDGKWYQINVVAPYRFDNFT